ncbi:MAG: Receptor domain [Myxococcales bacterium]|nr:Receptor domain [Myxococcales bacterium]
MRSLVLVIAVSQGGCFLIPHDDRVRCPTDRSVTLGNQDDVLGFAGCKRASGVTVRTGATIDLAPLHELTEITGDLRIGPTVGIDHILLNDLRRVEGTIYVGNNGSLSGLFLPRLEQAGRIEIEDNFALTTISMPRLEAIAGAFVADDNHGLELIVLSSLVAAKQLVITNHPRLELLQVDRLRTAELVRIENAPKLPPELVEKLRAKPSVP